LAASGGFHRIRNILALKSEICRPIKINANLHFWFAQSKIRVTEDDPFNILTQIQDLVHQPLDHRITVANNTKIHNVGSAKNISEQGELNRVYKLEGKVFGQGICLTSYFPNRNTAILFSVTDDENHIPGILSIWNRNNIPDPFDLFPTILQNFYQPAVLIQAGSFSSAYLNFYEVRTTPWEVTHARQSPVGRQENCKDRYHQSTFSPPLAEKEPQRPYEPVRDFRTDLVQKVERRHDPFQEPLGFAFLSHPARCQHGHHGERVK